MIASLNPESIFPMYSSQTHQTFRRKECAGENRAPVYMQKNKILPFQVFRTANPGTVTAVRVYDLSDNHIQDITGFHVVVEGVNSSVWGNGYFIKTADILSAFPPALTCGNDYYLKIELTSLTLWSEAFTTIEE